MRTALLDSTAKLQCCSIIFSMLLTHYIKSTRGFLPVHGGPTSHCTPTPLPQLASGVPVQAGQGREGTASAVLNVVFLFSPFPSCEKVEERPEKDFDKGVRTVSSLSAATLASLGGTSSRRGSGDTSISVDTEASMREIKDIHELKDQIQDVEGKYMQGLKKMKDSLAEVEEKYKKAMVSNAQLDNEKTNFMYQVDTLKDALLELEEQLAESKRQYEEKNKDFEREKHAHAILQFQFMEVKEALKQREELLAEIRQLQQKQEGYVREISDLQETIDWKEKKIGALERQKEFFDSIRSERDDLREEVIVLKEQLKQHGIIPNSEGATNGEICSRLENDGLSHSSKIVPGASHISKVPGDCTLGRTNEVEMKNEILENVGKREILQNTEHEEHTEETKEQEIVQEYVKLKKLVDERESLLEQIKKLKAQLEEKQNSKLENVHLEDGILENGTEIHVIDLQRDANRQISDLKFKLAKSEQEITALEQNVLRLEGQVARYKIAAENAERIEDELKAEKRKLQRELRSALDKTEELELLLVLVYLMCGPRHFFSSSAGQKNQKEEPVMKYPSSMISCL
ncbi:Leucine-rich repeat flightless-interacting protein 2 [Varanus komodoensis]|nr:Leucine-rich repeat flightless-interacting protein 2 [Varanus komodoensis]